MRIVWHGHSCFEVEDDVGIITDPHDGKSIGIKPPVLSGDIVLVSHDHFDHNCVRIVKGQPKIIKGAGRYNIKEVEILGIKTYHDAVGGEKRGENIVFKFTVHGMSFCHLGDLGHDLDEAAVKRLKDVDFLFAPIGNIFTIDGKTALGIAERLQPKVLIPMHYRVGGLSLSIRPIDDFLSNIPEEKIVKVGNEVEIEREDLLGEMEVWVFSL